MSTDFGVVADTAPRMVGRPVEELSDTELEVQGKRAHDTRNWVFLHGTAEQFATHTRRMLALEQEYLRRHPKRTWQGRAGDAAPPRSDDPVRALLMMIDTAGGRMHKLELHQAARECGVTRETLASLYGTGGYLAADRADRVLTEAGRMVARGGEADGPSGSVALSWIHEQSPTWDTDRERIIGHAPEGVFDFASRPGDRMTGEWWRAEDADGVVGYGWMDSAWGDAEILLAVETHRQSHGAGTFILDHLESEAAARGVNYVYNTVRGDRAHRARVRGWLAGRGYAADPGGEILRKRVGGRIIRDPAHPLYAPVFDRSSDRGPGGEEAGGYVDPEFQQY
ncbi:DUF6158 family protein [Gordonia sp. NPDC003429]